MIHFIYYDSHILPPSLYFYLITGIKEILHEIFYVNWTYHLLLFVLLASAAFRRGWSLVHLFVNALMRWFL